MKEEEIIAIIPARGGSKGIPRKNIKNLAGKPMISYTIEEASKSKFLTEIFISTEDDEIVQTVKAIRENLNYKVRKKITGIKDLRPKELANDDTHAIDVVLHALELLNRKRNYEPDIIVLLQPTSPLRTYKDIDKAIRLFLEKQCECVVSVTEVLHPLQWSLIIEDGYLKAYFDEKYFKMRRQDIGKVYIPNGAIYISRSSTLKEIKRFYCKKMTPYIMPFERSIDIDDERDFRLAELLLKENKNK